MELDNQTVVEIHDDITTFIENVIDDANADGAVLGLSGGIDSTTVAHLAVNALGNEHVHGLVMPGEPSTDDNMSDAERVAKELGISYDVIPINGLVDEFANALPRAAEDKVALGNTRARTRAVLLYFLSNAENRVVLGTGNLTEAMVGYYTKYGDGAVDCLPLGNLYKAEVRDLARFIGVDEDLVTKTPSAELWDGQTDEDELGLTYDEIDAILDDTTDGSSDMVTYPIEEISDEKIEEVKRLNRQSAHKRSMPPSPPLNTTE